MNKTTITKTILALIILVVLKALQELGPQGRKRLQRQLIVKKLQLSKLKYNFAKYTLGEEVIKRPEWHKGIFIALWLIVFFSIFR